MKLVFFGTSNVALPILEALSRTHEIAGVVTMPDSKVGRAQTITESPVSVLAKEMQLAPMKPERVKGNGDFIEILQKIDADIFVVVSYGQILPTDVISLPKYKTINVHFSLLPKYRGSSPIQTAILNGETTTGTSIFILDEQVDHGPILAQEEITIDSDDNALTLSEKMAFKSAQLIIPTIDGYTTGEIIPKPQDDALATRTRQIDKSLGKIAWSLTAGQIYNQFRAFFPWPGVWTKWDGRVVKIIDCIPAEPGGDNSTVAHGSGQVLVGGVVACGNLSYLQIKTIQLEGKKATPISDFLRGYPGFISSVLE